MHFHTHNEDNQTYILFVINNLSGSLIFTSYIHHIYLQIKTCLKENSLSIKSKLLNLIILNFNILKDLNASMIASMGHTINNLHYYYQRMIIITFIYVKKSIIRNSLIKHLYMELQI